MGKTRGVRETTPELRNRMVGMYEAGLGLRDIAAAVNCSQRTVKRWLNRFDKEGTVETRERCGRKRATTTEEDDAIIRLASQTPLTAAKAVLPALGLTCSVDTIRERLHKAGIHNWSPSRKHMQRIPLGEGDSATIQQAVWRPTGTQLGKKKLATKESGAKSKKNSAMKKKSRSLKLRARDVFVGDGAPGENLKQSTDPAEFVFSQQNMTQQEITQNLAPANNEIPNDSLPDNQTQFNNTLSLVQSSQSEVYQHHSGLNVAQNWPLDLVQGSHHYPQGQPRSMSHEQPPPQQQLQELHTHREQEHQVQHQQQTQQQEVHNHQMHTHHQSLEQHQSQHHPLESQVHQQQQQQINPELEIVSTKDRPEKIVRSDSCSNSSSSNDQMSDMDELSKDDSRDDNEEFHSSHEKRKKKGGKAKGTLETSVEIRNRMIGMSEAGLSTLSIALAINRSERTVKRWLERWNKEGNVQTKERKGRRRITTKEQDDAIIAMATQHPLTAAKHVAPALGLNCSVDTIRERLHKAGIHSWKLGKKQGEGNAVHTVHLWQPSGNRPNKPKSKNEKRKKSSLDKKRTSSLNTTHKKSQQKKKTVEIEEPKIVQPPPAMIAPPPPMQFHDNGPLANYVSGPEMMQPVHNLSASLVSSSTGSQVPSSLPQTMQIMGPIMQQRQDCRMANSVIQHEQTNPSVVYPSCMVNAANNHMDQPDPLNYEPYIWSF